MKNDPQKPPAHIAGTRRAPDVTATRPHPRHGLTAFGAKSRVREENSLIEPWIDVQADMDAINAGEGIHDPGTRRTWINGRLYGMHVNGTTWPIEGDGIIAVNRGTYNALTIIRGYNGVNDRSEYRIAREKGITAKERDEAIRIWRLRETALNDDDDNRD